MNAKKVFTICFWSLFGAGLLFVIFFFFGISRGFFGYMPPLEELQNPKNRFASEVISNDNVSLGRYYLTENRISVSYSQISPYMINALIATEDARFYEHSGIDAKAFLRALFTLGKAGGGSTITQQLSKQMYSPTAHTVFERLLQKPNEWVIAANLERLYSKDEIIVMYLNQFDFLYNAVGIKSAALVYFGTTPDKLKLEQAALLTGMCKNPSFYNPIRHQDRALLRRNTVLNQMEKYGYITSEECEAAKAKPIDLYYHAVDHKQGLAPYFREYLRHVLTAKEPKESDYSQWNKAQYDIDKQEWENNPLYGFCNKNKKADGSYYDLYSDGLRIYTTIDSRMQRYAEEAMLEHMKELQAKFFREQHGRAKAPFANKMSQEAIEATMIRTMKQSERYRVLKLNGKSEDEILEIFNTPIEMQVFSYSGMRDTTLSPMDSIRWQKHFLRSAFMSMDAHSGQVKAYVGGTDFANFQYDMVSAGRRQVGSTVKPYLYSLAMSNGYWPQSKVCRRRYTLTTGSGRQWAPKGSPGSTTSSGDSVTLQWGLTQSSNWVSAYLMRQFSPKQLVRMMREFGIKGEINPVPSLCVGSCEITLEEMVAAYTAFPNKGIRIAPLYVTRIEDANGTTIASFTPRTNEVIDERSSYKMIQIMRSVVDNGTGRRIRAKYGLRMPAGGKTGTTQNNSDGWFVGYTPSLVNGCWVGGEDRSIHFHSTAQGQGASMALPVWALYMKKVLENPDLGYSATEQFDIPAWYYDEARFER